MTVKELRDMLDDYSDEDVVHFYMYDRQPIEISADLRLEDMKSAMGIILAGKQILPNKCSLMFGIKNLYMIEAPESLPGYAKVNRPLFVQNTCRILSPED